MSQIQGPANERFPTTRWSLVGRAGSSESTARGRSLQELLTIYRPALEAYLVHTLRIEPQRAEDLLQEFLAAKFLERNLAAQADRSRGRFRSLVLAALKNFLIDWKRRESATKDAMGHCTSVDPGILVAQPATNSPAIDAFGVAWARELIAHVLSRMQAMCESTGRGKLWGVFQQRVLVPTFEGTRPPGYGELVGQLDFASTTEAANALVTAKRMFDRLLREVVSEYVDYPDQVKEEIDELHAVLAQAGPGRWEHSR